MNIQATIKELVELAELITQQPKIEKSAIDIRVQVREDDSLIKAIEINDVKIEKLGIYEVGGMKVWVVKK